MTTGKPRKKQRGTAMNTNTILKILERQSGAHFEVYSGYAEPGYNDSESGRVALGNWNSRTVSRKVYDKPIPFWLTVKDPDATYVAEDQTMPRIGAILEKLGIALEWDDEWAPCSECGKLIRTQPDSYSWTASYWLSDGDGIYCQDCLLEDPNDYLEYLEGNPDAANTLDLDLKSQGYRHVDESYENGWYGTEDDPHEIAGNLRKIGVERFIFEVDSVGQFNLTFSVYVHELEYHKLNSNEGGDQ